MYPFFLGGLANTLPQNYKITIKKPFAQMIETKGRLSWLGQTCKYREENYEDFVTLLSVVSVLKKQLCDKN